METPAVTTIVTHTKELITVFSRDLELITRVLFSTNFIQDDILLQMSSEDTPTGKAAIVVEAVKKKLEIAPERFAEFLKIISENAKDIVDGLSSTYQKMLQAPTAAPSSSSHPQSPRKSAQNDKLTPMSGQAVEKPEDTASNANTRCDANSAISSSLITDGTRLLISSKQDKEKPENTVSNADTGYETSSVVSASSSSQITKQVAMDIEIPDHILSQIRKKYMNIKHVYKKQCPCQLRNIARLELVECQQYSSNQSSDERGITGKSICLSYSSLFKGDQDRKEGGSTRILIVGEAGIGKTLLCASIAEDWANGKLFQEYLMVFLLPLNQRGVASAQNLQELFKHLEFDSKVCSTVATYLMANKKENILMIADGWDELSESNSSKESFLYRLLFGDLVPSSSLTVVVSSKYAPETQQSVSQFIAVKGFSEETTKSYIQCEFSSNPEKLSSIMTQLQSNPLLGGVCNVPLSLSMICCYFQSYDPLPGTMPKLYEKLAWNLAQLKINSTKGCRNVLIQKLSNYRDLPNELQASWLHLCRLGFEKCQADFSQAIASTYLSTELETFGLLKPAALKSDEVMFSFLCPAFRYYLAVSHLTTQPLSEQLEVIKSMRHVNPMFYRFYLCVNENPSSDIVSEVVQKLNRCCKDMCLLSFECKNEIVDREVAKSLCASGSTIMLHAQNAYECVAVVHMLEKIEQPSSVEINFKNCKLKARQVPKLASVLGNRSKMIKVKGLDLSDNGLSDEIIADFFSRASSALTSLEKLFLRSCDIGEVGFRAIIDALAISSCKSLTQLDLSFNSLSVACLECFQQHLDKDSMQKMEILILKGSLTEDINVSFLKCFATTLSTKCHRLRRLDLSDNKLSACNDPEFSAIVSQLTARLGTNFDLRLDDMSEVDKNFLAIMEESIRTKGTIDHTIAHGVIVGPARSGKNTLLERLTGEGPPDPSEVSPSTGVLENVVKVEVKKLCAVASDYKCILKWRKLKYDEEALELMMTTAKNYSHSSDVPRPVTIKYIHLKKSESKEDKKPPLPSKTKSDQASKQDIPKADKPQESECTASDDTDTFEEENKHIMVYCSDLASVDFLKRALKLGRMDALREHLESSWSLYLTNTGGQIEFQEHLPLLVCGPSIFFVTFPLHHDLDKPYEVRYEYPDGSVEKYSSPSSLMEEILQTLATIYTLDFVSVQIRDEVVTLKPRVFIIGTHKDCLMSETEEIAQIDEKIRRYIEQTSLYHEGSIQFASNFDNSSESRLIFTVNNLCKDDDDFQNIRFAVQQTIEEKYPKEFTVQCPSSWLIFSLILREKHKSSRVLTLENCFKIAQECGISSQEELTTALSFIHSRLGLIRYFDDKELNSLVVIDPQILFEKITDLIKETFVGKNANENEIKEFRQKGIISLAVVKRISERSSEEVQLPFTWLMKLLNHRRLAALFKDQYGEKLFFPSALCHVSKPPDPSVRLTPPNAPPKVLIAFETGFCPRGIAGALIKCLMTNEMNSRREWYLLPHKIFRNQVSFSIGAYDVTIKILPTHLEFALDPEEDSSACADSDESSESEIELTRNLAYNRVRTQIDKCMKIVTKLYKKCEYFWTFYCTLPDCKTHPHPAVIASSKPLKLRCKIFHKCTRPPKGSKIWNINKRGVNQLNVEVQESHLGKVADSMTEWEGPIADKLKLKPSDIANIKTAYPRELNLQTRKALNTWKIRNGSKATYAKLIKIFEQADYKSYADEVRRIAHISNSDTDDSSGSGEEHPQIEQPQTYPDYKPHALPQVPQPMTLSESAKVYVMAEEEDAGEVCSVEVLESQNKSFVPQFTGSKSQSQDHLDEEQLPKDDFRETALVAAVNEGHVHDAEILVKNGADVNYRNKKGHSILWIASFGGYTEIVLLLVRHHAAVDLPNDDEFGDTALVAAVNKGHLHIAEILVKNRADLNYRNKKGYSVLSIASLKGHTEIVLMLLRHHAAVDLPNDDDFGDTALVAAVTEAHLHVAEILVKNGADVNYRNKKGYSILWKASFGGYAEIVLLLVRHRAAVDLPNDDDFGDTALVTAVNEGHLHVAEILVKNKADVNYRNKKGKSVLWIASFKGRAEIVLLLLRHHAAVDLPNDDDFGDTALVTAVYEGHFHVAEILVKNKADVNYRNKKGHSILSIASLKGRAEIVLLLLRHHAAVDLPNDDDFGNTALVAAVNEGHLHVAEVLVKNGAYVNYRNKKGHSVLLIATLKGFAETVLLLLRHHAAVDLHTESDEDFGDTALMAAVHQGYLHIAEILVKNGADVNFRNKNGQSVLWTASFGGHTEIVLLLLRHHAAVDLPTDDEVGETALCATCTQGRYDEAALLIDHGADVNYLIKTGVTPMYFATQYNHLRLVELLLAHGADINKGVQSPLYASCGKGNIEMVQLLVHHHAAIDQPCDDSVASTPLIAASVENHIEVAKFLVEHGANINYQNQYGYSALHAACNRGSTDSVKLLIQSNANIELKNKDGRTGLMLAAWRGYSSIVEELIRAGAQIDAKDQEGFSSLILAIHNKHVEIAESLLNANFKANPNITDNIINWSPLHFAAYTANMHITKLLLQKGANAELRDKTGKSAADICEDEDVRDELRRHAISQAQTKTQTTEDENQRNPEEVTSSYQKLLSESLDLLEDSLSPERWEKRLH